MSALIILRSRSESHFARSTFHMEASIYPGLPDDRRLKEFSYKNDPGHIRGQHMNQQ
jgi:hypothetical protein